MSERGYLKTNFRLSELVGNELREYLFPVFVTASPVVRTCRRQKWIRSELQDAHCRPASSVFRRGGLVTWGELDADVSAEGDSAEHAGFAGSEFPGW
jgi:hypothetical protein